MTGPSKDVDGEETRHRWPVFSNGVADGISNRAVHDQSSRHKGDEIVPFRA